MTGPVHDNAAHPFGSARFAGPKEIARAGLFTRQPHSLLIGFYQGRALWYSDMGGGMCVAGPRSGKLRDLLAFNICAGIHAPTILALDVKGELAGISRDQTPDNKFCLHWNPHGLHDLPQDRINPLGHLRKDSPTLISDVKRFAANAIPPSGAPQSAYFEGRAREFLEALSLAVIARDGGLTYPALYEAINLLVMGGDGWLDIAFEMSESDIAFVRRIEAEITDGREDTSGGFVGILGELTKAFACLSDPVLMEALSPPFTAALADLCASDQTYQLYLMPPGDMAEPWAPVIKSFFVGARTYKARAPAAPRQTWVLDEIGNLKGFPQVVELYTRDAGLGVRPWGFWQSTAQLRALGPGAEQIIPASAGLQNWFGVRDLDTASTLSRMLGQETLAYRDEQARERALHAKRKAAQSIFQGGNPFKAAMELHHHARMADLPVLKSRPLMTSDEVLGLPPGKQIIFVDGLAHPILADRFAYYDLPFMAGRYHPNPYFPPADKVRVMTPRGPAWRRVITEPVPKRFAHYPQYRDGTWSRIA
ncbi:type IV secretory system conjugative DNA transfer family protein [Marivibrio halodurans]|uniref:Type IV secretory system conjugative DNA transfer family protein n=1 Tax=Marivibrio halodurans TaxID=2039722 RepID=A0A8J7V1M3_9PROT|nr:type IV secretory system conjugative DNA transfer family protein [Marivibrio halodurans]MBP5856256.1 type IV secretory system conjugative DNA transfer family protein [Marivibrio halodurans]